VTKLCTLPLLAGGNIASDFVTPTVAGCIDVVIHTGTDRDGARRIREISALTGRVEGAVEMATLFTRTRDGLVRGGGFPAHLERFEAHDIDIRMLLGEQP
jgi:pilus assembly protein CpaF